MRIIGPIINKFLSKLSKWKTKNLSIGGRLTLLKWILGSLGIYFFSLFKAPEKIINKLESYRSKFFWGAKEGENKISWISWSVILNDKSNGGLGVGSLKAFNLALLAKWIGRFKTEQSSL